MFVRMHVVVSTTTHLRIALRARRKCHGQFKLWIRPFVRLSASAHGELQKKVIELTQNMRRRLNPFYNRSQSKPYSCSYRHIDRHTVQFRYRH